MEEIKQSNNCLLQLPLGDLYSTFKLEEAICNHGFFMMSPNIWNPSTKSLRRPLRLSDSTMSINVSISTNDEQTSLFVHHLHGGGGGCDEIASKLTATDRKVIRKQVTRMLRLTEKDEQLVRGFQNLHEEAKHKGFGRLFRSPCLFEDIVKSILLCNSTWSKTLSMARALCRLQAELRKDDDDESNSKAAKCFGNFPSSRELINLKGDQLRDLQRSLGYRVQYVLRFARKIERPDVSIEDFEEAPYKKVHRLLVKQKGFGPFVRANILSCIGFYHRVPADTETMRHLEEVHSRKSNINTAQKDAQEIYDQYAPFQCLAYWFELSCRYEDKVGKLSELDSSKYDLVTASSKPWPRCKSIKSTTTMHQ